MTALGDIIFLQDLRASLSVEGGVDSGHFSYLTIGLRDKILFVIKEGMVHIINAHF